MGARSDSVPPSLAAARSALHEPLCRWVLARLAERPQGLLCVGVNGPQGGGKSTLTAALVELLAARGLDAATVSVDDFYLTHAEQRALAERHPGNPYLAVRGCPGTHEVALGERTLDALASRHDAEVRVPSYDKGAHGGEGDRHPEALWPAQRTPLAVLFFEGWMLGFRPAGEGALADPRLAPCDRALEGYGGWLSRLHAFVHLDAREPSYVLRWRVDAERARREREGRGLSDAQALAYVERFLPAYATWTPRLREEPLVPGASLRVELGEDRLPTRALV